MDEKRRPYMFCYRGAGNGILLYLTAENRALISYLEANGLFNPAVQVIDAVQEETI